MCVKVVEQVLGNYCDAIWEHGIHAMLLQVRYLPRECVNWQSVKTPARHQPVLGRSYMCVEQMCNVLILFGKAE